MSQKDQATFVQQIHQVLDEILDIVEPLQKSSPEDEQEAPVEEEAPAPAAAPETEGQSEEAAPADAEEPEQIGEMAQESEDEQEAIEDVDNSGIESASDDELEIIYHMVCLEMKKRQMGASGSAPEEEAGDDQAPEMPDMEKSEDANGGKAKAEPEFAKMTKSMAEMTATISTLTATVAALQKSAAPAPKNEKVVSKPVAMNSADVPALQKSEKPVEILSKSATQDLVFEALRGGTKGVSQKDISELNYITTVDGLIKFQDSLRARGVNVPTK